MPTAGNTHEIGASRNLFALGNHPVVTPAPLGSPNPSTRAEANVARYTYRVFTSFVGPYGYHVTRPIKGKNVVILQTRTLRDLAERLVVQAELVDVSS